MVRNALEEVAATTDGAVCQCYATPVSVSFTQTVTFTRRAGWVFPKVGNAGQAKNVAGQDGVLRTTLQRNRQRVGFSLHRRIDDLSWAPGAWTMDLSTRRRPLSRSFTTRLAWAETAIGTGNRPDLDCQAAGSLVRSLTDLDASNWMAAHVHILEHNPGRAVEGKFKLVRSAIRTIGLPIR